MRSTVTSSLQHIIGTVQLNLSFGTELAKERSNSSQHQKDVQYKSNDHLECKSQLPGKA